MENLIEIYTDGSCIGNPGPGGWAFIVYYDNQEKSFSGGEASTTNNRMEMSAMIHALKWVQDEFSGKTLANQKIIIYSDSNLIVSTINSGWKRKANLDLWEELDRLRGWLNLSFRWVKAHDKNRHNNKVDELAQKTAQKFIPKKRV